MSWPQNATLRLPDLAEADDRVTHDFLLGGGLCEAADRAALA